MEPAERIERLLAEVRAAASPQVWQRVDALMQAVVELYGDGLGRMLARLDQSARHELAADELVASLLALHGLHPLPPATRIARALDAVAKEIGVVELVALDDRVARLRVGDAGLAVSREILEQLITEAAPEIASVEIEGLRAAATAGPLVQIDLARSRAAR